MVTLKSFMLDEDIQTESHGEITNTKLFNFKLKSPEPFDNGLFCQKIFGTLVDYTCKCNIVKYSKGSKILTCKTCGVDYTEKTERRNRFGHINFNKVYYINPFILYDFFKMLGLNKEQAENLSYKGSKFIIKENKTGNLESFDGKHYEIVLDDSGSLFSVTAIYYELKRLNIDPIKTLQNRDDDFSRKYLNLNIHLFDMFNSSILVMPPVLRDIGLRDGKVEYDLKNSFYLKLIRSSIRVKSLNESNFLEDATLLLYYQESINIQNVIASLMIGNNNKFISEEIPAIIDNISKKDGRIRNNILGKRVDYSGRTLIIPDPTLPLDTIKVPEYMCYKLLEPFIISGLLKYYMIIENSSSITLSSYKKAKQEYKDKTKFSFKVMQELSSKHRVILNRAPTLHRYGIFGFKFIPYSGNAIKINGLVCAPFNADFDGDQMPLHLALSEQARKECDELMSIINNLMSTKDINQINVKPSHESVVGGFLLGRN